MHIIGPTCIFQMYIILPTSPGTQNHVVNFSMIIVNILIPFWKLPNLLYSQGKEIFALFSKLFWHVREKQKFVATVPFIKIYIYTTTTKLLIFFKHTPREIIWTHKNVLNRVLTLVFKIYKFPMLWLWKNRGNGTDIVHSVAIITSEICTGWFG